MDQEGQLTRHKGTDRRVDNKRCRSCDNFLYVFKGAAPRAEVSSTATPARNTIAFASA